jgi:MFS transporter, DHA1 family, multidrug resistance protein
MTYRTHKPVWRQKVPPFTTMAEFSQRYGTFLLLCLIGFATFFSSYMRIPVLPLFAVSLGAGPVQVGIINGSFMLATGLLSIPGGLLADRYGRRILAIGGIVAAALSSLLVTQCSSSGQLAVAYLLFGVGLAAFVPSMLSQVADALPAERLGQAYGWYTTAVYAAITLGPATGGIVAKSAGLRQVFFLSGGLLLLVAIAAFLILPRSSASRNIPLRRVLAESVLLLSNRRLLAGLLASLGSAFGFGTFISFMPLHAAGHGLDPAQVGLVFAAQALTNVVGRIPVGMAVDRIALPRIIVVGLLCFASGLALLGRFTETGSLAACAVLLGLGMALIFTAIGALIAQVVPALQRGLAMGMYNSCVYLGMMAGASTLGALVAVFGYPAGFALGGLAAVVTVLLFLLVLGNGEIARGGV